MLVSRPPSQQIGRASCRARAQISVAAESLKKNSIHNLADHFHSVEELSPAQGLELDEDLDADHLSAKLANQPDRGGCGAACREYIIDDQLLLAGLDRVRMRPELIGAVLELVGVDDGFPGKLSGLANRDEP